MRHKLQTDFCSTASTSLLLLALSCCAAAADAARGEIIAKRWCAACHLVSADQKQAVADVPSFGGIARMRLPAASLKAFLADPHPKMPDMSLSRSEIEDLVAYIKSLDK